MSWFIKCLQNYAVFSGRARRKEFWFFYLFYLILDLIVNLIDYSAGTNPAISLVFGLVFFLPYLGVSIRRLHDTSRSGAWILINLIPLVGQIVFLVFLCESSHPDNRFGPDPTHTTFDKVI